MRRGQQLGTINGEDRSQYLSCYTKREFFLEFADRGFLNIQGECSRRGSLVNELFQALYINYNGPDVYIEQVLRYASEKNLLSNSLLEALIHANIKENPLENIGKWTTFAVYLSSLPQFEEYTDRKQHREKIEGLPAKNNKLSRQIIDAISTLFNSEESIPSE